MILSHYKEYKWPVFLSSKTLICYEIRTNFFQAILLYLLDANWRYIAIVHTDDLFGQYGSQALKNLGIQHGICVDVVYEVEPLKLHTSSYHVYV